MAPWKGGALFVHLMQMEHVMDVKGFLHVMGRYWDGWASDPTFDQGYWAKPDVCAANAGVNSSNPSSCSSRHDCECKQGSGRFTSAHNKFSTYGDPPGENGYQDAYANAMWDSLRSCAAPVQGDGATSTTFPCQGMAETDGTPRPPPPPPTPTPTPTPDPGSGGSTGMSAPYWTD
jgi:hypothetical protein